MGLPAADFGDNDPALLVRAAEDAMIQLRAHPLDERIALLRTSLYQRPDAFSPNSDSLAQLDWPLVVTTNYDDVYLKARQACRPALPAHHRTPPINILGRSRADCERVIASLMAPADPIVWAIQGFIGSPATFLDAHRPLATEVVISHKQYQDAITAAPHFRRAFAEIYRHRTLIFLGSGILEDYLVNLFSEILAFSGPPLHGHFALLHKDRVDGSRRVNAEFLQNRLHIRPVRLDDHSQVQVALKHLGRRTSPVKASPSEPLSHFEPSALQFRAVDDRGNARLTVEVRLEALPVGDALGPKACAVYSIGRAGDSASDERFSIGTMAEGVFRQDQLRAVAGQEYTYSIHGAQNLFAVAARRRGGDPARRAASDHHLRDLGVIPRATTEVLEIASARFDTIHFGVLSAGRGAPWDPTFSFAQMLVGIRAFGLAATASKTIVINVVDRMIWGPIVAGRIPIAWLLSSGQGRVHVAITSPDGTEDRFVWYGDLKSTVRDVMEHFRLDSAQWRVEIDPAPVGHPDRATPIVTLASLRFSWTP